MKNNSVMDYENVLPPDFDGIFRFTNPSKEDFVGVWAGREYLFPSESTVPIMMPEHSPIEIQHIRKKFAKDLAEREFFKSKGYAHQMQREGHRTKNGMWQPSGYGMSHAGAYTGKDLEPFIEQCLKPLPASKLVTRKATDERTKVEERLHTDNEGKPISEAISDKTSLRKRALES